MPQPSGLRESVSEGFLWWFGRRPTDRCCEHNEARPVVFDKFSHRFSSISFFSVSLISYRPFFPLLGLSFGGPNPTLSEN